MNEALCLETHLDVMLMRNLETALCKQSVMLLLPTTSCAKNYPLAVKATRVLTSSSSEDKMCLCSSVVCESSSGIVRRSRGCFSDCDPLYCDCFSELASDSDDDSINMGEFADSFFPTTPSVQLSRGHSDSATLVGFELSLVQMNKIMCLWSAERCFRLFGVCSSVLPNNFYLRLVCPCGEPGLMSCVVPGCSQLYCSTACRSVQKHIGCNVLPLLAPPLDISLVELPIFVPSSELALSKNEKIFRIACGLSLICSSCSSVLKSSEEYKGVCLSCVVGSFLDIEMFAATKEAVSAAGSVVSDTVLSVFNAVVSYLKAGVVAAAAPIGDSLGSAHAKAFKDEFEKSIKAFLGISDAAADVVYKASRFVALVLVCYFAYKALEKTGLLDLLADLLKNLLKAISSLVGGSFLCFYKVFKKVSKKSVESSTDITVEAGPATASALLATLLVLLTPLGAYGGVNTSTIVKAVASVAVLERGMNISGNGFAYLVANLPDTAKEFVKSLTGYEAIPDFNVMCKELFCKGNEMAMALTQQSHVVLKDASFCRDLTVVWKNLRDKRNRTTFTISQGRVIDKLLSDLEKHIPAANEVLAKAGVRSVPVGVLLWGASQIGKTWVATGLAASMAPNLPALSAIYQKNAMDKFSPGYEGQNTFVFDEFRGTTDEKVNSETGAELLNMISNAPHRLNMADLSDKGTLFTSKLVIVLSNVAASVPIQGMSCYHAMLKRHICVRGYTPDEWKTQTGGPDWVRFNKLSAIEQAKYPHIMFEFYPVLDVMQNNSFFGKPSILTFDALLAMIRQRSLANENSNGLLSGTLDTLRINAKDYERQTKEVVTERTRIAEERIALITRAANCSQQDDTLMLAYKADASFCLSLIGRADLLDQSLGQLILTDVEKARLKAISRKPSATQVSVALANFCTSVLCANKSNISRLMDKLAVAGDNIQTQSKQASQTDVAKELHHSASESDSSDDEEKTSRINGVSSDGDSYSTPDEGEVDAAVSHCMYVFNESVDHYKTPEDLTIAIRLLLSTNFKEEDVRSRNLFRGEITPHLISLCEKRGFCFREIRRSCFSELRSKRPGKIERSRARQLIVEKGLEALAYSEVMKKQVSKKFSKLFRKGLFETGSIGALALKGFGTACMFLAPIVLFVKIFGRSSVVSESLPSGVRNMHDRPVSGHRVNTSTIRCIVPQGSLENDVKNTALLAIRRNVCVLKWQDGSFVSALFVKPGMLLTVRHFFLVPGGSYRDTGEPFTLIAGAYSKVLYFDRSCCVTMGKAEDDKMPEDVCVYNVALQVPKMRDISAHFVSSKQLERVKNIETGVSVGDDIDVLASISVSHISVNYSTPGSFKNNACVSSALRYTSNLKAGGCGTPIVCQIQGVWKICAQHVAFDKRASQSLGGLVSFETVNALCSSFTPLEIQMSSVVFEDFEPFKPSTLALNSTYTVLGKHPGLPAGSSNKTGFKPSILAAYIPEASNLTPSYLGNSADPRYHEKGRQSTTSLLVEAANRKDPTFLPIPYPREMMDAATDSLSNLYIRYPAPFKVTFLSLDEAIAGTEFVAPYPTAGSPGFPSSNGTGGKGHLFDIVDGKKVLKDAACRRRIERRYDLMRRGIVPSPLETCSVYALKDEIVKVGKKTRRTVSVPFEDNVVIKMAFGSLNAAIQCYSRICPMKLGINVYSRDWDAHIKRMLEVGTRGFAGDFVGQEYNFYPEMFVAFGRFVDNLLRAWANFTDEQMLVVTTCIAYLASHYASISGCVFVADSTNPSGSIITVLLCMFYTAIKLRCAFIALAPAPYTLYRYDQFVRDELMGDDSHVGVADSILDWFNGTTVAAELYSHNIVFTTAEKTRVFPCPATLIVDDMFLSCQTVSSAIVPGMSYAAKIKEDSVLKGLVYVKDVDGYAAVVSNANNNLRAVFTSGKQRFECYREKVLGYFQRAFSDGKCSSVPMLVTYDHCMSQFKNDCLDVLSFDEFDASVITQSKVTEFFSGLNSTSFFRASALACGPTQECLVSFSTLVPLHEIDHPSAIQKLEERKARVAAALFDNPEIDDVDELIKLAGLDSATEIHVYPSACGNFNYLLEGNGRYFALAEGVHMCLDDFVTVVVHKLPVDLCLQMEVPSSTAVTADDAVTSAVAASGGVGASLTTYNGSISDISEVVKRFAPVAFAVREWPHTSSVVPANFLINTSQFFYPLPSVSDAGATNAYCFSGSLGYFSSMFRAYSGDLRYKFVSNFENAEGKSLIPDKTLIVVHDFGTTLKPDSDFFNVDRVGGGMPIQISDVGIVEGQLPCVTQDAYKMVPKNLDECKSSACIATSMKLSFKGRTSGVSDFAMFVAAGDNFRLCMPMFVPSIRIAGNYYKHSCDNSPPLPQYVLYQYASDGTFFFPYTQAGIVANIATLLVDAPLGEGTRPSSIRVDTATLSDSDLVTLGIVTSPPRTRQYAPGEMFIARSKLLNVVSRSTVVPILPVPGTPVSYLIPPGVLVTSGRTQTYGAADSIASEAFFMDFAGYDFPALRSLMGIPGGELSVPSNVEGTQITVPTGPAVLFENILFTNWDVGVVGVSKRLYFIVPQFLPSVAKDDFIVLQSSGVEDVKTTGTDVVRSPGGIRVISQPIGEKAFSYSSHMNRRQLLRRLVWANTQPVGEVLLAMAAPQDMIVNALRGAWDQFIYWGSGSIKLSVSIESQQFQQGNLIVSFSPLTSVSSALAQCTTSFPTLTFGQHGFIQAGRNSTLDLVVPYKHFLKSLPTRTGANSTFETLGTFSIVVMNSLLTGDGGSGTCIVNLFVEFIDGQLEELRAPDVILQMGQMLGKMANVADTVAKTVDAVASVGEMGELLDFPNVGVNSIKTATTSNVPYLSNCKQISSTEVLDFDPAVSSVVSADFGFEGDETLIAAICERSTFLNTFEMKTTDSQGTVYLVMPLTPVQKIMSAEFGTVVDVPACTYAVLPFELCQFEHIEVTLHAVCTGIHRATLAILTHFGSSSESVNFDNITSQNVVMFQISDSCTSISVKVPWRTNRQWLKIPHGSVADNLLDYTMGELSIRLMSQVQSMPSVAPVISINVFMAVGGVRVAYQGFGLSDFVPVVDRTVL